MRAFAAILMSTFIFYSEQLAPLTDEEKAELKTHIAACLKQTGADAHIAGSIWKTPDAPANNEAAKCFYKCMLLEADMIDAAGKLNAVNLLKGFAEGDPEDMKEIGDECEDIKPNADICEYAYQIMKCVALTQLD